MSEERGLLSRTAAGDRVQGCTFPNKVTGVGGGGVDVPLRAENLWLVMACVEKCKMKTVGVM